MLTWRAIYRPLRDNDVAFVVFGVGTGHPLHGGDRTSFTGVAPGNVLEGTPNRGTEEAVRSCRT